MVITAFLLGMFAGGFLAYELIELFKKYNNKKSGDEYVE